jgi:hypothetical protein
MTGQAQPGTRRAAWPASGHPAVRAVFGSAAIAAGIAAAWAGSILAPRPQAGAAAVLCAVAVLVAAGNGYGKAYSP